MLILGSWQATHISDGLCLSEWSFAQEDAGAEGKVEDEVILVVAEVTLGVGVVILVEEGGVGVILVEEEEGILEEEEVGVAEVGEEEVGSSASFHSDHGYGRQISSFEAHLKFAPFLRSGLAYRMYEPHPRL